MTRSFTIQRSVHLMMTRPAIIILLTVGFLFSGCKPTELVGSWKDPSSTTKDFKKIGVVTLSPNMNGRAVLETELAGALRAAGAPVIATFDIFPLAGRNELIEEMELTDEQVKEHIRKRIEEFNFDAILVMAVLDVQKEERYHAATGSSISVGFPAYPAYNYGYTGYYGYVYNTVYTPGYYETASTYFLESNLYDVATEQLIWTGQTRTKDPKSIDKEAAEIAKLITHELKTKGALKLQ